MQLKLTVQIEPCRSLVYPVAKIPTHCVDANFLPCHSSVQFLEKGGAAPESTDNAKTAKTPNPTAGTPATVTPKAKQLSIVSPKASKTPKGKFTVEPPTSHPKLGNENGTDSDTDSATTPAATDSTQMDLCTPSRLTVTAFANSATPKASASSLAISWLHCDI